jgi:hypothetical protein
MARGVSARVVTELSRQRIFACVRLAGNGIEWAALPPENIRLYSQVLFKRSADISTPEV